MSDPYARAGVDTEAGDRAVDLMKRSVEATHRVLPTGFGVVGGLGGFAGLIDVSALKDYRAPVLATGTDGVGTKVALAQAIDKHDTIGQDLVGMLVDDIVVVGATPLAMTDYIACGALVPDRIADIVRGIAEACSATGTALVGGETAEHPGLLGADEYDVAGAVVGVVERDEILGPDRIEVGDVVVGLASSGLHSNGFSLVRHVLAERGIALTDHVDELGGVAAEALLTPTRLYTAPLIAALRDGVALHGLSHVTGGGIAANLSRVLPVGTAVELTRGAWRVPEVFRVLASLGGFALEDAEGTWNLGIGMFAVLPAAAVAGLRAHAEAAGIDAWELGTVQSAPALDAAGWVRGAKGVDGGAVRLSGRW